MKKIDACRYILIACFCGFFIVPLKANYLHNPDFAEGINCWHGEGDFVYLKPDGTEGSPNDKGAVAVLKIPLRTTLTHTVYQEFNTVDEPNRLHVRIEIRCSADFKRMPDRDDYAKPWTAGSYHTSRIPVVPKSDFWIRLDPGGFYRMSDAIRRWHTIDATFKKIPSERSRTIQLCVPYGTGAIYIRKVEVSAK